MKCDENPQKKEITTHMSQTILFNGLSSAQLKGLSELIEETEFFPNLLFDVLENLQAPVPKIEKIILSNNHQPILHVGYERTVNHRNGEIEVSFTMKSKRSLSWKGDYADKTLLGSRYILIFKTDHSQPTLQLRIEETSRHPGGLVWIAMRTKGFFNRVKKDSRELFEDDMRKVSKALRNRLAT